ncbi:hypothetical protein [Pseudomonas sp. RIT-PI-AD]|uniref:hypothetical protein n=1 Tax=Pseudomonas sp. RIT-PI-AD TaxID=3035294 RepID=UPI0021DA6891|nr:hypothetical protein [Pseudomonas sp. RIT-PI-AD]
MSVIINLGKLIDALPSQEVMRIVYKGEQYGFQESQNSQNLLIDIVSGADSIEEMNSQSINPANVN